MINGSTQHWTQLDTKRHQLILFKWITEWTHRCPKWDLVISAKGDKLIWWTCSSTWPNWESLTCLMGPHATRVRMNSLNRLPKLNSAVVLSFKWTFSEVAVYRFELFADGFFGQPRGKHGGKPNNVASLLPWLPLLSREGPAGPPGSSSLWQLQAMNSRMKLIWLKKPKTSGFSLKYSVWSILLFRFVLSSNKLTKMVN